MSIKIQTQITILKLIKLEKKKKKEKKKRSKFDPFEQQWGGGLACVNADLKCCMVNTTF